MKHKPILLLLLPLCFMLAACPFESTVPAEEHPVEKVDSSLIGYWYGIVKDGSDFFGIEALDITQESDSVYKIIRYGKAIKGDMVMPDTAYFTGYISYINNQRFMNVRGSVVNVIPHGKKPAEVVTQTVWYLASFQQQHDTLSVNTVSETFSPGRKNFGSAAEFKQAVVDQAARHDIYDDVYTLSYHKIPRPQPLKPF